MIDGLEGDRLGLVIFAGEAYVQLPITTDYSAAKLFLESIGPGMVPVQGTNVSDAINKASESFSTDEGKNRAIILITDGENHDSEAIQAAEDAKIAAALVAPDAEAAEEACRQCRGLGTTIFGPCTACRGSGRTSVGDDLTWAAAEKAREDAKNAAVLAASDLVTAGVACRHCRGFGELLFGPCLTCRGSGRSSD